MRDKILIVDGIETERAELVRMLEQDYGILEAGDGELALKLIEKHNEELAAVLIKLMIPKVEGLKVVESMHVNKWIEKVPVLIIDKASTTALYEKCYEMGVWDFLHKPFEKSFIRHRVVAAADSFQQRQELQKKVIAQTQTMKKQYQVIQKQSKDIEKSKLDMMDVFGAVAEYRNAENTNHIRHVKAITQLLAEQVMKSYPEYGLDARKIQMIVAVSALHDIGKIAIPDHILLKPGKLTDEEMELMRSHTTKGCEILNTIQETWSEEHAKFATEVCRYHHERYDGNGYPDGLQEDDIPISAQIVALADVYDALISDRVYKKAYTKDQAYHMIVVGECGVFSQKLLGCFRDVKDEVEKVVSQ